MKGKSRVRQSIHCSQTKSNVSAPMAVNEGKVKRTTKYPSFTNNKCLQFIKLFVTRSSRHKFKIRSNPILSRPVPINLFIGSSLQYTIFRTRSNEQWTTNLFQIRDGSRHKCTLNTEKRVSELGLQWRTPDICCMSEFDFDTSFLNKLPVERNSSRKHYACDFLYTTVLLLF